MLDLSPFSTTIARLEARLKYIATNARVTAFFIPRLLVSRWPGLGDAVAGFFAVEYRDQVIDGSKSHRIPGFYRGTTNVGQ